MKPKYHIVAHTHWDREWYLSYEEFRAMLVRMIDDLIDLLKSDSDYKSFLLDGQTVIIEDYLTIKPEKRKVIGSLVKNKRLFIGPWYVLADEFLTSGESMIRNLLFGSKISSEFGGGMKIGYLPDTFGHAEMLPSVLNGFGIRNAIIYRGFGGERNQEKSEYNWIAPDGSKVLMIHLPKDGYSGAYFHFLFKGGGLSARFRSIKKELDRRARISSRLILSGGDHHWPDPGLPAQIDLLRNEFKENIFQSNLPDFIEGASKEIPADLQKVQGELRFGYRYAFNVQGGIYSSRIYLKQDNWRCQVLLERYAEPLNVRAVKMGMDSRSPLLTEAWRMLIQNQAHDSICGCSSDAVHSEMVTRFKKVKEITKTVINDCFNAIVPDDGNGCNDDKSLILYNPSPFVRSSVAEGCIKFCIKELTVGLSSYSGKNKKFPPLNGFAILDDNGKMVPFQVLDRKVGRDIVYSKYSYPRETLCEEFSVLMDAENVPPLGFKNFKIERKKGFKKFKNRVNVGKYFLENEYLIARIAGDGTVAVFDKTTKKEYTGLNIIEDSGDVGDGYNYSPPVRDNKILSVKKSPKIRILEKGPLRGAIEIAYRFPVPESATPDHRARSKKLVNLEITSIVYLGFRSRYLLLNTSLNNQAEDHRLRVLFNTDIRTNIAYADSPFSVVKRKQKVYDLSKFKIEHPAAVAPMQKFVTLKDKTKAVTLMTEGLPEYELKYDGKGTLALTLLRSVGLMAGDNLITRPGGSAGWYTETPEAQCRGNNTFRYALFPHAPSDLTDMRQIIEQTEQFHYPFYSFRRKTDNIDLNTGHLISVKPGSIVLSALKESEDKKGYILRLWNPANYQVNASIELSNFYNKNIEIDRLDETRLSKMKCNNLVHIKMKKSSLITLRFKN